MVQNQNTRNKNENLKEECLQYLGGKSCYICDNNYLPTCCYDFHHYKDIKEQEISRMIQRKKIVDIELKVELDKCKVVCKNCHAQITARLVQINKS